LRLISYPVYLVHQPVQTIAEAAFRGQAAWVVGSVAFVAALILASLLSG
jgi:peptidoglycan/LPS O-acetylase OafA/YrhL